MLGQNLRELPKNSGVINLVGRSGFLSIQKNIRDPDKPYPTRYGMTAAAIMIFLLVSPLNVRRS